MGQQGKRKLCMYQREIIMLGVGSGRELRPWSGVEGGLLIGGHGSVG
jgi:hypothetical protein